MRPLFILKYYSKICPEVSRKNIIMSLVITTIRIEIRKRARYIFFYLNLNKSGVFSEQEFYCFAFLIQALNYLLFRKHSTCLCLHLLPVHFVYSHIYHIC